MKIFLKKLIYLVIIVTVIYPIFILFYGKYSNKHLFKTLNYRPNHSGFLFNKIQEINNIDSLDVLITGSSHAYRGFNTQIFANNNINSFNLGSSAQTPINTEYLLDRYIKELNPKIIIIDVYPRLFSIDGEESITDFISNIDLDKKLVRLSLKYKSLLVTNTLVYKLMSELFDPYNEIKIRYKDDIYIRGGYVSNNKSTSKDDLKNLVSNYNFKENQLNALNRIIRKLKLLDINIILCYSPMTKSYYSSNQESNDVFNDLMIKIAKDQNITFINFNQEPYPLKFREFIDFKDKDHLNNFGASKLTNYFISKYFQY